MMKKILKLYRTLLLILFIIMMGIGSFALYQFYNFIQPIDYETQSVGTVTKPGTLIVSIQTTCKEPLGIILISPSGKEYTQSSRDIENTINGSERKIAITTGDLGEWKIKYRKVEKATTTIQRTFKNSNAAILISTKATHDSTNKERYIVSMNMSTKNYTYTIKAIRRSDGFSLTSSGDGGATLNLSPYAYTGVWDFYLNTTRGSETYSTMFSYTF